LFFLLLAKRQQVKTETKPTHHSFSAAQNFAALHP